MIGGNILPDLQLKSSPQEQKRRRTRQSGIVCSWAIGIDYVVVRSTEEKENTKRD
jgi:hypothetical protein